MLTIKQPIALHLLSLKQMAENMVTNRVRRALSLKRARLYASEHRIALA